MKRVSDRNVFVFNISTMFKSNLFLTCVSKLLTLMNSHDEKQGISFTFPCSHTGTFREALALSTNVDLHVGISFKVRVV